MLQPTALQFWVPLALTSCLTSIGVVIFSDVADGQVHFTGFPTVLPRIIDAIVSVLVNIIYLNPFRVITILCYLNKYWIRLFPTKYIVNQHLGIFWMPLRLKMPSVAGQPGRMAIVTGGATVVFKELLDEVVTPDFIRALLDAGFENVLIQCGSYKEELHKKLVDIQHEHLNIELEGFIHNMKEVMKECRGLAGIRPGGVVFSHAGTGTIADCWEAKVANVIVANPNLMDNHQAVFAEEMAQEHETVILGRLGHLAEAVPQAMAVIEVQGLDNLQPPQQPAFPVSDDVRLHFIDNLFDL